MPGLDGFQVMEGLKESNRRLLRSRSHRPTDHKLRLLKSGQSFISKPFDLAEVLMRVHNLLEVRLLHLETKKLYDRVAAEQKVSGRSTCCPGPLPNG
jgi:adenylate cyclase